MIRLLGGSKFFIAVFLKLFDSTLSLLIMTMVIPVSQFIFDKDTIYKKLHPLQIYFDVDPIVIMTIIILKISAIRWFVGRLEINVYSNYIVGLRFKWLSMLLNYFTNPKNLDVNKNTDGKLISDWYTDTFNGSQFIDGVFVILSNLFLVLIFFCYTFYLYPFFSLVMIGLSICYFLVIVNLKKQHLSLESSKKLKYQQDLMSTMLEILKNKKDIFVFNLFAFARKKLFKGLKKFKEVLIKNKITSKQTILNSELLSLFVLILILIGLLFSPQIFDRHNLPELLFLITASIKSISYTNQILSRIQKISLEYYSFRNLIDKLVISNNELDSSSKVKIKKLIIDKIDFKINDNVGLKSEYIELNSGEHYMLTGDSGCGKSSFLDLLVNIRMSNSRNIYLINESGEVIENNTNYYSYVSQNVVLFGSNLIEAICANLKYDINLYRKIVHLCQLESFTNRDNFKNINNELSGGEKSRIALARALYFNRPVIVLDESMSSIPSKMEKLIFEGIYKHFPEKIILQVSHEREPNENINSKLIFEDGLIRKV